MDDVATPCSAIHTPNPMADQLLQQAQDLFEGQIVSYILSARSMTLMKTTRISRVKSSLSCSPPSSSLSPVYV